jgi:drug/metabolite transporter (DMT)-like permease
MPRLRTTLLALLVTFLWGSSFVLTKIALAELGPLTIAFTRWLIATLAFAVILPLQGHTPIVQRALRQDFLPFALLGLVGISAFLPFALLGLVGISAFYTFQNLALRYTTAVNVGLLINFCTVFIAVLSVLWLGERLGRMAIVGIVLSFAGATLVGLPNGRFTLERGRLLGDGLTLLAALCGAIYTVYGKRIVARYPPAVVTGLAAAFGTLFLLPGAAWEGLALPRSATVWGAVLTLGLGSGALANFWWWRILQHIDAARAGAFILVIPVVSTLLAVAILREPMPPAAAVGGALVLLGVYLTQQSAD